MVGNLWALCRWHVPKPPFFLEGVGNATDILQHQTDKGHLKSCLWGPELQEHMSSQCHKVTVLLQMLYLLFFFFNVNSRWKYKICIFVGPTTRWTMSSRTMKQQCVLLSVKALASPSTPPHLNTSISIRFLAILTNARRTTSCREVFRLQRRNVIWMS